MPAKRGMVIQPNTRIGDPFSGTAVPPRARNTMKPMMDSRRAIRYMRPAL